MGNIVLLGITYLALGVVFTIVSCVKVIETGVIADFQAKGGWVLWPILVVGTILLWPFLIIILLLGWKSGWLKQHMTFAHLEDTLVTGECSLCGYLFDIEIAAGRYRHVDGVVDFPQQCPKCKASIVLELQVEPDEDL